MDEQRLQAYMALIEQLLGCPQGEEGALLQANEGLVDEGLLVVMGQYADWLESQGNGNAGWLRQFATQLAQGLGVGESGSSSQSQEDAMSFGVEILQLIDQTQGDRVQVYEFFRANVGRLDEALLRTLPDLFAMLIQKFEPAMIAAIFGEFGNLIQQFPLGSRRLNLELGIAAYEQALQVYTRDAFPEQWAGTQNNLALAYGNRIRGERAENLERAIAAYEQALQVYTRDAFPEDWAMTQNNLASAYSERIRGERAENLERAIAAYEQALQVRTRDAFPEQWAGTQNNLAIAYSERIRGERAENLERAINASEQALQVRTRDALPQDCRRTAQNLGNLHFQEKSWAAAVDAYQVATAAADTLYQSSISYDGKGDELKATGDIPRRLAYAQAQLGNLQAAVLTLEQSRARGLSESLNRDRANLTQLQTLAPTLYTEYQDITQQLRNLESGDRDRMVSGDRDRVPDELIKTTTNLRQRLNRTIAQIRQVPGYEEFLTPTKWEDIQKAVTSDRSLVYLVTTSAGSLALILYLPSSPNPFSLGEKGNRTSALSDISTLAGRNRNVPETLLNRARELRAQQTPAEAILWECLRDRQLNNAKFRRQHNINSIIADFYCHSARLIIEVDGGIHATSRIEDQNRDRWSIDHGFTVLRFTNDQIYDELETVLTTIANTVSPPTNLPSPLGRGAGGEGQICAITPIWLNDFTETQLNGLLQNWFTAYETFKNRQTPTNRQAWDNTIDSNTRQIWDFLMEALVQKLQEIDCDRITLIPTSYLSLLPLHAAWTEDPNTSTGRRYALDDINITYAPNTQSLTPARLIADRVQADTILAIDNPLNDLLNSEQEVQMAVSTFPQHIVLKHGEATVDQVRSQLPNAAIAHFSCHGTANLNDPLASSLFMSDDLLTLKDIFALNLADSAQGKHGLRIAVLSACETGMIGTKNADEAISLPNGLLQAGVAAIIASLWAVGDRSTMLLLSKFYDLWRTDHLPPDQALRQAQIWLRDSTAKEIAAYGGFFTDKPSDRPYAHPFHWAAFSYTGV